MRLPDEKRDELADAICSCPPRVGGWCDDCGKRADALAPLVTRWLAEVWDEGWDERDNDCSEPLSPPRRNPYRGGDE